MTKERMETLLGATIDHIMLGENIVEGIKVLLGIGFTEDELINELHFSVDDVTTAVND